jgi:hypothetical protein
MATAICAAWWSGLTVALGALGAILVLNLSHATWFVLFRPMTTAVAATLPLLSLGLVPAALVARRVYPWAGAEGGIPDEVLARIAQTRPWMSPWPVLVRTLISLGVWATFALWLEAQASRSASHRASGVGLPLLAITATVTSFDWMMRVEPGWTSTIYGMYVLVAGFYGATALVAIGSWLAIRRGILPSSANGVRPDHIHAHGRLMLTAVCLWGYVAFFQLLLQWIGNLPAEAVFYVRRGGGGGWAGVSWLLILGHFIAPCFLLLSRPLKRDARLLAAVGVLMFAMHLVDVAWLVMPSRVASPFPGMLAPFAAVVGLAGAWGAWRFSRHSPVAVGDPEFARGASYESP